jgi:hypothetical protein
VKKVGLLFAAVVIFGLGFFTGTYNQERPGSTAYSEGWTKGLADGENADIAEKPTLHHYEFKQNGASIYRFDPDTGDACWIQISVADQNTPMLRCSQ